MIRFILALFIPFRWIILKMGADYNQFINIMKLKLTLDFRRENTGVVMAKQTILPLIFGCIFALIAAQLRLPSFPVFILVHTFIMIMMAMMIITEFTTILFDTSDNAIIQPLPVSGNTTNLARNAHILIYLSFIALSLSLPTVIFSAFKFGLLQAILFLATIFLNTLLTLFLANILYLTIMRFAGAERLKNLMMYFQIFVSILFMGGMQLGSRFINQDLISGLQAQTHWYTILFPPMFFSGFIESITKLNFDTQHLIFCAEALFIPVIAVFTTGKYLTPMFNRKLVELDQSERVSKKKSPRKGIKPWFWLMSLLFVSNREERASFKLIWRMTGRERQFKLMFFPSIGILVIVFISQFMNRRFNADQFAGSDQYLLLLYFLVIVAINLIGAIKVGNNRNVSWILKNSLLSTPANFFKGAVKAAFARFFIPFYAVASSVIVYLCGDRVLPDILIVLLLIYLITLLLFYFQDLDYPFTLTKETLKGGERTMKMFLLMALVAPIGLFHHFLIHWFSYANLILIPLYLLLIFYTNRILVYRRISWRAVDSSNRL